jgi:phosphoribosylglycinamide formyltransferase-1
MIRIAIFASGSGSNAENIINYFKGNQDISVSLLLTNNSEAGVIKRAKKLNVPILIFTKKNFSESSQIIDILINQKIDWIILAGFLWLVPSPMISAFPNKIINIHPALLPKYGGKGMWGHFVHEAVVSNKEIESGITIHLVNEKYDEGEILFQAKCDILESDTALEVANKIHELEQQYFPSIIEKRILN